MKKLHKAHLSALGGRLYGVQYVSGLMHAHLAIRLLSEIKHLLVSKTKQKLRFH